MKIIFEAKSRYKLIRLIQQVSMIADLSQLFFDTLKYYIEAKHALVAWVHTGKNVKTCGYIGHDAAPFLFTCKF